MRLIDAHRIESILTYTEFDRGEKAPWLENEVEAYRHFMKMIEDAPTAYDEDKIVELLEAESKRWMDSGEEYNDQREMGVAEGFKKAIDIVKAGGIERK